MLTECIWVGDRPLITLSVALTFCVLSAVIVLVACFKRYQEVTSSDRKRKQAAAAAASGKIEEQKNNASSTVSKPLLAFPNDRQWSNALFVKSMSAYESFLFVTAAPSSSLLPATTAYAESAAATAFIPIFLHVRGSGCWLATTVGCRYA